MAEPCSTPSLSLTPSGLFQRLINVDCPESSRRAIAIMAAVTLCLSVYGLLLAILWQASVAGGRVDGSLVGAFLGVSAFLATLAGVVKNKKESADA